MDTSLDLRIVHKEPETKLIDPPIVFLHGMWQGSWVYEKYFMDYFVSKGLDCYAINLRGHNGSPANGWFRFTTIGDYVEDLRSFILTLDQPPIVIAHSMGGFVTQKYLEKYQLPQVILLASVPPSGVWRPTLKVMVKMPFSFLLSNIVMKLWYVVNTVSKSRYLLFGDNFTDNEIQEFIDRMNNESYFAYLGMLLFSRVQVKKIPDSIDIRVTGNEYDNAISKKMVKQTADAFGVEPVFFDDMAHMSMLDKDWKIVADYCIGAIEEKFGDN